jgi:hypothetical protein
MKPLLGITKWRILLQVLPLTLLFGVAKWGTHYLGWEPWTFDSLTGTLFGAVTFVLALVLGGTLSDYRICENAPTSIVNAVETIQDCNQLVAASYQDYDSAPLQHGLVKLSQCIYDWLKNGKDIAVVYTALNDLNRLFVPLEQKGGMGIANNAQAELSKIRLLVSQIQVNRDTEFLGPAYVMLFVFLSLTTVALLLIGTDNFSENITISSFLFAALIYLLALIRDLDNPFQYDGSSCIDVDLTALQLLCDRLN